MILTQSFFYLIRTLLKLKKKYFFFFVILALARPWIDLCRRDIVDFLARFLSFRTLKHENGSDLKKSSIFWPVFLALKSCKKLKKNFCLKSSCLIVVRRFLNTKQFTNFQYLRYFCQNRANNFKKHYFRENAFKDKWWGR